MTSANPIHPEIINHPAVWKAGDLISRDDWMLTFTPDELDEMHAALAHDAGDLPIEKQKLEHFPLPALSERLTQIQHNLEHGSGGCMIRGLPVERYSEEQVRRIFWGLSTRIGTPITQSAKGERIFSVRDEGYRIGDSNARGPNTSKRLSFHTDRCDVIGFLCLKQAKSGGENQLVSSMAIYNELRERHPGHLRVLMEPFYYARHNVDTANDKPWCRQPIFSFQDGHFACAYLRVLIDRAYGLKELPNMTPQQSAALVCLEDIAADPAMHVTFRQEPGDILFLNNWVTLHRRNQFEDHEDRDLRRHILRVWLSVPNSRPLDPLFKDNYGATEAGAIRGGMRANTST